MEDLIIKDEEFTDYVGILKEIQDCIESELDSLIIALTEVYTNVITEGNFHTNLESFVSKVSNMKDNLFYVTDEVDTISTDFVSAIDEIDESIY